MRTSPGWRRGLLVLVLPPMLSLQACVHAGTDVQATSPQRPLHDTVPPQIPADLRHPAFLVFSKTNGFRHEEAIPAANAMFDALAKENGWSVYKTENGAAFTPETLSRFDAVVLSNASGDLFDASQRDALRRWMESGGGFVGLHAAGDSSHAAWDWYMTDVIGTTFIGHPMNPQFQQASVRVEDKSHPATADLADSLQRTDEWYSFDKSPRGLPGLTVLATLDESTYRPDGDHGLDMRMGADHPIVWWRCAGDKSGKQGRIFYSAMGHTAASYSEPDNRQLIRGALAWAMRVEGNGCDGDNIESADQ